ncbi:MAG TPA: Maf family nucleotide pyrophosphatase [Gammaproteobacteria bacterium]|nr:Maf family nucleotide pyrophosphatase [Gammaproteobacteria bacterium]
MRRLILASTSKYRRELLARLGMPFDTAAPGVDETPLAGEAPRERARRLAGAKARSLQVADAVVIGSDQVASLDGTVLRKPGGPAAALRQLQAAQGNAVLFHTAVTVLDTATAEEWSHVDLTEVRFARLPSAALERYLEIDAPFDCAGSFKSEGLGVALFERVESTDPTALIGLPLIWLAATLRSAGLDPLGLRGPRAP